MAPSPDAGVHLVRTAERVAEVDALAERLGGRVGLAGVLDDLNRTARPGRVPGLAVSWGFRWDGEDERSRRWWPQGITTSADASEAEAVAGRSVVVTSAYSKTVDGYSKGARLSFVDVSDRTAVRYRHVLLVEAHLDEHGRLDLRPVPLHAGGIVWHGDHLHVAGTRRGLATFRLDDILRVPSGGDPTRLGIDGDDVHGFGYRYVLPVRFGYEAVTGDGLEQLRYSFLSLDRSASPHELVAGEYGSGSMTTRLVRYEIDPATVAAAHRRCRDVAAAAARGARHRAHPGRDGRGRPVVPHHQRRPLPARKRVDRDARRPAAFALRGAGRRRGHHLLALDRPALVAVGVPEPPLRLRDGPLLLPLTTAARGRAAGTARRAGRRSPTPRRPPRAARRRSSCVRCVTASHPGAGRARRCTDSSRVGVQPSMPRSKVTGGSASTASSSMSGSGSRPSAIRSQPCSSPRPDGSPSAQPTHAGSSRRSRRSSRLACSMKSGGAIALDTHWSGGGMSGGVAVVRTSSGSSPRSPYVASARTRSTSTPSCSWTSVTWPVDMLRPRRRTSVRSVAGPGRDAER